MKRKYVPAGPLVVIQIAITFAIFAPHFHPSTPNYLISASLYAFAAHITLRLILNAITGTEEK